MKAFQLYNTDKDEDRSRGLIVSTLVHLLLFILILLPTISFPYPKPELQGILVTFGKQDEQESKSSANAINEDNITTKAIKTEKNAAREKPIEKKASKKSNPKVVSKKVTLDASKISATDKKKNEAARKKAEAQRVKELETEKRLEAERIEKAEARNKKKQFGEMFGDGSVDNAGNGKTGDPDGDPNTESLEGLVEAKGKVGTGLSDRGIVYEPKIIEHSQKAGRVVIEICIDNNGYVISANYTQRGSTTTDSELVKVALKNASKYKFSEGTQTKQCGNINIDFKLK